MSKNRQKFFADAYDMGTKYEEIAGGYLTSLKEYWPNGFILIGGASIPMSRVLKLRHEPEEWLEDAGYAQTDYLVTGTRILIRPNDLAFQFKLRWC